MPTILDTLIVRLGYHTDDASLRRAQRRIQGIRDNLDKVARNAAVFGTVLSGALFGVGRSVLSFETEMNRLRRDTGATAEQFKALRKQAIELGSSADFTTISIEDAAVAQRTLSKGGLDIAQTMKALPSVLRLVAATELDVGYAADVSAKLIKAYGLTAEDTERILNQVAFAQAETGVKAQELIESLLRVSVGAVSVNQSFEDTVAILSTLVDQGAISEQAATGLTRSLTQLAKAEYLPREAEKAFERLGVDLERLQFLFGQGKTIEAMKLLGDAGLELADASIIFGDEGAKAALKIAKEADTILTLRDRSREATGTLKRMADEMNAGLPGAVNAAISAFKTFLVTLGDAGLTGWIERASEALLGFINWLTTTSEWVRTTIAAVLILGPVLLGLAVAAKTASFVLGGLALLMRITGLRILAFAVKTSVARLATLLFSRSLWVSAIGALRAFGAALLAAGATTLRFAGRAIAAGVAGVIGFATSIWAALVPALAAFAAGVWATTVAMLANPITWIVALIVGLIAAIAALIIYWDDVVAAVKRVWDWLRNHEIFGPIIEAIEETIAAVGAFFTDIYSETVAGVNRVINWITSVDIWGGITAGAAEIPASVATFFSDALATVIAGINDIIDWLGFNSIWDELTSGVGDALAEIEGAINKVTGFFKNVGDFFGFGDDEKEERIERPEGAASGTSVALPSRRILSGTGRGRLTRPITDHPTRYRSTFVARGRRPRVMDEGGVVTKPTLAALAMNSRPEAVIPLDRLNQLFRNLMTPPVVPPLVFAGAGGAAGSTITRTTNINIDENAIVINAPGADAEEIAGKLHEPLRRQLENLVDDNDSTIAR